MANQEQLKILKKGTEIWNKWKADNQGKKIDLRGSDLKGADLNDADLSDADLSETDLRKADLSVADLNKANLSEADLSGADLSGADLSGAILSIANLNRANLSEAALLFTNIDLVNLDRANLSEADLSGAILRGVDLKNTIFHKTKIGSTLFADVDLSVAKDLLTIKHTYPSSIGTDTLIKSKGKIPVEFLRQCGLSPWEIEIAKLYVPDLNASQISDIISVDLFQKRTQGPLFIGGVFISYSHKDSKFVDKLRDQLKKEEIAVWLDHHDMVAGKIEKQIIEQIRIMDVMVIVLSEASINSDWVENELEMARKKEKSENRDIICPVALDDSWKAKIEGNTLWRQVAKSNILDFSGWKTKKFDTQFKKLVAGIKKNYPKIHFT